MIDSSATVFVVDDEERMRHSLHWLINSVNLRVATFPSARAFLTAYQPDMPGCLVLDVRMPEMSGLELMEQLHARGVALPIIFLLCTWRCSNGSPGDQVGSDRLLAKALQ